MLKRRHFGVDTWASPIGAEVSTPSVYAKCLRLCFSRESAENRSGTGWTHRA